MKKIKEFFSVSKEKIILTIIIFLIMIFFLLPVKVTIMCKNDSLCSSPAYMFVQIYKSYNIEGVNYLYILIELLIAYIISCLIIFVYKKIKSNNKQHK